ncbi:hypothetical protein Q73_08440 [Bacillus coahuilensis m2-6]|uniref:DUF3907 domain-containing protein n=1 Tax=Bacillus coahuilensis p1.1.43 TaxID=1150625 RepID=A0A147K7Y7_9BACI|nr:DUF3907 family protein [Bacillus coahuilensis]KUP06252.1 hypothetical protein Q75_08925 [Bacillus coahuilensis p1.1.43]KUP07826.1 hypothetical protein Q73_08440 [Bacillus coahuilensis m2-6]
MSNVIVQTQLEDVKEYLENLVNEIEDVLNYHTIDSFSQEVEENKEFNKELFSSLRRLVVYCQDNLESCSVLLHSKPFNKIAAERTLYKIYHQCIQEFFSPKKDLWYEDSRSAYTGKNAIVFRQKVPKAVENIFASLETPSQRMREELEYYETDYRTKMLQINAMKE